MSLAEDARAAALAFEAVKSTCRQVEKGFAITIVVHPDETPLQFITAPRGTRYQVVVVELADDNTPVSRGPVAGVKLRSPDSPPQGRANSGSPPGPAGGINSRSILARERYRNSSEAKQAVARACLLPTDKQFQDWAGCDGEQAAADYIRDTIGGSRAMIDGVYEFYTRYMKMETKYLMETGRMAIPR